MSIQDDYFDVAAHLKGGPLEDAFTRIWEAFCTQEEEMVRLLSLRRAVMRIGEELALDEMRKRAY